MPITKDDLEAVVGRPSLFKFLRNELKWPVDPEDTFTYGGPQLTGEVAARVKVSRIVPFSVGDPFIIFLAEFETPLRRTDLREILRRVREEIRTRGNYEGRALEEIVFVCATEDYKGIRFAHFETRERGVPKLRVFGYDRGQGDGTRTLREFNLPALVMPRENILGEPDWTEGRARWMTAWDVEQVTGAFFKRYKEVFTDAQTHMVGIEGDDKRLCAQRLFNRLLFIRFLEKKGWLTFNGRRDYLRALWDDYQAKKTIEGGNFYNRLKTLFFAGLNKPHVRDHRGETVLSGIIGDVPYLNGGLFDDAEDREEAKSYPDLVIYDAALAPVVTDFFYAYNFTVTESTPDDVEVAVDPEMLGKVFEELVTASERHGTGSYYTPRGIVSFMCREALKGYLGGHAELVDERTADGLSKRQATDLIAKLKAVKVVDPAGGSGAYVLGMLHELFDLIGLLEVRADPMTPQDKYKRKLEIIQNCLYAVDKEPFAVNIARLRLWLSLAVEFEGDTPQPLPNLEYKVEVGDSLSAPSPEVANQVDARADLIRDFDKKKREYANPYYDGTISKSDLKKQIEALRKDIADWTHAGQPVTGFDWRVEFCEVFQREESEIVSGGFDIVLANPPYVRQELIKDQKPTLKAVYPEVYAGTADLYCYFYARALQLIRPGGMLSFITPNKWFRAGYGANLRRYIAATCRIDSIVDFGELPVFQAAATFPMVFVAQRGGHGNTIFTQVKSLKEPYPDVLELVRENGQTLPDDAIQGADWSLTDTATANRLSTMEKSGIKLNSYINQPIFRGILTGFNAAFVIDGKKRAELIAADPKCSEIIKPLAVGDDVRRWRIRYQDKWIIVTKIGVDINRYPHIFEHLIQWKSQLQARTDQGNHWWELRSCAYYDAFDKPKIVFPDIAKEARFAYDENGTYSSNTTYFIALDDFYLLGVLNSTSMWKYCKERLAVLGDAEEGGRLRFFRQFVERLPIPNVSDEKRRTIATVVRFLLYLHQPDEIISSNQSIRDRMMRDYFEQIVNGLVHDLYFANELRVFDHIPQNDFALVAGLPRHEWLVRLRGLFEKIYDDQHSLKKSLLLLEA